MPTGAREATLDRAIDAFEDGDSAGMGDRDARRDGQAKRGKGSGQVYRQRGACYPE
jgi:hypothetical protein